jgi:nucleoside-diphosphate-sugar epimerase
MKKVLVTGATGFVGSHVLEALMQEGDVEVIAACRDRSRLLPGFKGEVREGDLRGKEYRERVLKDIDVVCHAMSWTAVWSHQRQSHELYLAPTVAFIDSAINSGVTRFINVSTTSAASPVQSTDPKSRGIPRPFWPHLCTVIAIEDYLRQQSSPDFTVVNLRLGIFAGHRYGIGILPLLLPRLKTHLVPWVAGGRTSLPIIDGRDIGQAFACAVKSTALSGYEGFNIIGPEVPTVREVIEFIHREFGYPKPHFGVPFAIAYPFAWLMEKIDPVVPWEPLVTRSIVHLMEETAVDNQRAREIMAYQPVYPWREAVRIQIEEMRLRQGRPMRMAKAIG